MENGPELELGWPLGGKGWMEQLHSHQVLRLEVLDGMVIAGFHDVQQNLAPVIDEVKVLGLDQELLLGDAKCLVIPLLLSGDGEEVLEIGQLDSSSLQDSFSLCFHIVQVHVHEGVILQQYEKINPRKYNATKHLMLKIITQDFTSII